MAVKSRARVNDRSRSAKSGAAGNGSRARSILELLKEDHENVREALDKLSKAKEARKREKLLQQIEHELKVHTQLEEEIFYPAFRESGGKEENKLFHEATEEHHVVDLVLPEILDTDPGSDEFAGKAKVLKDLVEHHADEEEKEMFKLARKRFSRDELKELGARFEERKGEVQ